MHYHNLVAHGGNPAAHNQNGEHDHEREETERLQQTLAKEAAESVLEHDSQKVEDNPLIAMAKPEDIVEKVAEEGKSPPSRMVQFETSPYILTDDTMVLLMFHVPSEQLDDVLKDLPAIREPSVVYLKKSDYYCIDTIIPYTEVESVARKLRAKGVEDITYNILQRL